MKKILLLFLVSPVIFYAQLYDYKIKVELDNSAKYRYEEAYYKASIESSNREIADRIKGFADKYFTELRRSADYMSEQKLNSAEVEAEFNRLKYYGEEILNLLPLISSDEITGSKMVNTVEKAYDELNYSMGNDSGNLRKLVKKNMYIRELSNLSDEELQGFIINKSSETTESLNNYCSTQNKTFKRCLIDLLLTMK